jgi:hypothetical protein
MRSHPTLVVHRSRYSCAMCTQNHVFVREKSSLVQPFPEVCGASGTNIWERDWVSRGGYDYGTLSLKDERSLYRRGLKIAAFSIVTIDNGNHSQLDSSVM